MGKERENEIMWLGMLLISPAGDNLPDVIVLDDYNLFELGFGCTNGFLPDEFKGIIADVFALECEEVGNIGPVAHIRQQPKINTALLVVDVFVGLIKIDFKYLFNLLFFDGPVGPFACRDFVFAFSEWILVL